MNVSDVAAARIGESTLGVSSTKANKLWEEHGFKSDEENHRFIRSKLKIVDRHSATKPSRTST